MYDFNLDFNKTVVSEQASAISWLSRNSDANDACENNEPDANAADMRFLKFRKQGDMLSQTARCHRKLGGSEKVNVWIATDAADQRLHSYYDLLSEDERSHAESIRSEADRRRYISARILLRFALSYAVNSSVSPFDWKFSRTENGKPVVADGLPQIQFNVSHNEHVSVVVTSEHGAVGVDVEALDRQIDDAVISEHFSLAECKQLQHSDKASRNADLVTLWTMKEAYSKMLGLGLSADLRELDFASHLGGDSTGKTEAVEDFGLASLKARLSRDEAVSAVTIASEAPLEAVNLKVLGGSDTREDALGLSSEEWRQAA